MDDVISIVINCDTRPGIFDKVSSGDTMLNGTRSIDFLTDGVRNKINFFKGFDIETTLFIDSHEAMPFNVLKILNEMQNKEIINGLVLSKHREYYNKNIKSKWNDINFLQALFMARGKYIVHFDGDMASYRDEDDSFIHDWISLLESGAYDYISYPSPFSPNPDGGDWDYWWASTRFFICKRDSLKYDEIIKCLEDSEYLYGTYGEKKYRCPWLEHILGIIAGNGKVFYPPMDYDKYMIFSWARYVEETYKKIKTYADAVQFVKSRGGISYPCDVRA